MTVNTTNNKRKAEDYFSPSPLKLRRKVLPFSSNAASSIESSSPSKLNDLVELHAGERIPSLGTVFHAYAGIGVRSDGSKRDFKVKIGSSKVQVGKGNSSEDAAHSNPVSGIRDNYFKLVREEVKKEKKISPKKAKVLSKAQPKKWKALDFTKCDIGEYLPMSSSLIDHSVTAPLLNGTHTFDRDVNRKIDCTLEREIRPIVAELIEKVAINALTPASALLKAKDAIEAHFKKRIEELEDEKLIAYTKLELKGTQSQDLDLLTKYLFKEFQDDMGNVDFDKTLRLLEHQ